MSTAPEKSDASAQDETLLAYLRTLSVEERLALNDAAINAIEELRASFGEHSKAPQKVKKRDRKAVGPPDRADRCPS